MNNNVRQMTLAAVMAALQTVLLYLGSVLPSGRLAMAALAGVLGAVLVLECGFPHAAMAWIVASALGLLLFPRKGSALFFAAFFGWYPIGKSFAEGFISRVKEWALKLLGFNVILAFFWGLYSRGFLTGVTLPHIWIGFLLAAAEVAFVVYDVAFSGLIAFYQQRLRRRR